MRQLHENLSNSDKIRNLRKVEMNQEVFYEQRNCKAIIFGTRISAKNKFNSDVSQ